MTFLNITSEISLDDSPLRQARSGNRLYKLDRDTGSCSRILKVRIFSLLLLMPQKITADSSPSFFLILSLFLGLNAYFL